jgi:hypothetical protein
MSKDVYVPEISAAFSKDSDNANASVYCKTIHTILKKILPDEIFFKSGDSDTIADQRDHFHARLPLVSYSLSSGMPANLSFYALHKYRSNAFKFFFEMISHWLIPGKRLNVVLIYAADFHMPDISNELYTLCEVMINVDNIGDFKEIQSNLPIIENEIRLGVDSSYYARRILEIKGISPDEKTAMIQEYIVHLVRRLPTHFDFDVISEMQHILIICRDDFKAARECRHLSRLISIQYLFRKALREAVKKLPKKRHLYLKLFRAKLRLPTGDKSVLNLIVGVNFLQEQEIFEKKHLLTAIQNYIPSACAIEDSFFANRRGSESICTLYIEIEKNTGEDFTNEEIRLLRHALPMDLKDRIEHLMHPVFMPRNEEEVMRNVLNLSSQVKYIRDIPQVIISFDEQTTTSLFFTVILVRAAKPGSASIQNLFHATETILEYIPDRTKKIGILRKKYIKEANVFRIKLPKEHYLRKDHTIDLFKARQFVFSELCEIIGEVRDFNGGMISKQNELLCSLRNLLGETVKYNELLLENFFYSLAPASMRTISEPVALKKLFLMQLDSIEHSLFNSQEYSLQSYCDLNYVYAIIKSQNWSLQDELAHVFTGLQISGTQLAKTYVKVYDTPYIGYIYRCDDLRKQQQFCEMISACIEVLDCRLSGK